MKKTLFRQTLSLALAGLVLGLSACGPSSPRDYKQYRQEINRIQWSPDGKYLLFNYVNYNKPDKNIDNVQGNSFLYYFHLKSKTNKILNNNGLCGIYDDKGLKIVNGNSSEELFETSLDGVQKRIFSPHSFECPLFANQQKVILYAQQTTQKIFVSFDRITEQSVIIPPDESVQKFIQDENIPEYRIEHIFEKNGILRLIISGSVGYTPENPHPPKTYATALLQDNKITQIEKLIYLEKPFGIRMVFWGLSPDNKLIFGKETGSPPLEYFEYDYEKHQRNPRPDLDKINTYLTDGRILDPDAFSPDFSQFVSVQGIAEDAERNTIRELALYDVATGKRETLLNINDTLPKGDYKTVVR